MIYEHIGCTDKKSVTLYHPIKPRLDVETPLLVDLVVEEITQSLLTIGRALTFKNENEDDTISNFINEPMAAAEHAYHIIECNMSKLEKEELTEDFLVKNGENVPILII